MKQFLLLLALIFLAISTQISAQNAAGSVDVGVYSAYQFTQFSDGTPKYSGEYDEGLYSVHSYTFGGLVEYRIDPSLSLIGIMRYEYLNVENSIDGFEKNPHPGYQKPLVSFTYSLEAPQVHLTIQLKRGIGRSKFSTIGGVTIGIIFADNQEERYVINDPNIQFPVSIDSLSNLPRSKGYTPHFTDESRTSITLYKGEIYQRTALQLGLTAGLQYDLPIYTLDEAAQKFVTLTPSVLFNYNLTTFSDYEKLRAWNVSAGFVLKVGL